jgi:hypothetical protein
MKKDTEPPETFAYWSGYAPSRTVAGAEQPLSSAELRAEAERFRSGAQRFELAGDPADATLLREAAADMERRASGLDKDQSSDSI